MELPIITWMNLFRIEGCVEINFNFIPILKYVLYAKSPESDKTQQKSDLVLHCLPMFHKRTLSLNIATLSYMYMYHTTLFLDKASHLDPSSVHVCIRQAHYSYYSGGAILHIAF